MMIIDEKGAWADWVTGARSEGIGWSHCEEKQERITMHYAEGGHRAGNGGLAMTR